MKLHMPRFDQSRVLVVGDLMLDRYWHGNTSRVSPEAPVPVVDVKQIEDRPGGAGNVALNISALGSASVIAGLVGRDEAGQVLQQRLEAANILCRLQVAEAHPTITKLRVISRHQQLLRLDFEDPFVPEDSAALAQRALQELEAAKALVISDYAKGALQDPQVLIQAARKRGIPVLVDPKGTDFRKYRGATLLTPNLHEFEAIVGRTTSEQDLVEKAESMIHELELQALLVTRGEHGMSLIRPGEPEFHLPARAMEVFDVTGAGDTVISVLAAALGAGDDLPNAVALANLAAGIVVGKLGTAAISAPELRRAVQREQGSERGAVTV
ncbi:D-glycero-beta-D-manno-heptose-7-phosphate kinase, partial [Litorivivens sp.]